MQLPARKVCSTNAHGKNAAGIQTGTNSSSIKTTQLHHIQLHQIPLRPSMKQTSPFPYVICLEASSTTQHCSFTIQQAINAGSTRNVPSLSLSPTGAKHVTLTACAPMLLGLWEKDTMSKSLISNLLLRILSKAYAISVLLSENTSHGFHAIPCVLYVSKHNLYLKLTNDYDKASFCFQP